jgi:molecular chaperone HscB
MDTNLDQLLELAGRRDYFALLGITRGYRVDGGELKRNYLRLSRQVHPDFFASDPQKLPQVLTVSAAVNEAYRTLEDPVRRAEYLLRDCVGAGEEEETRVSTEFLGEVMEWQEAVAAARGSGDEAGLARVRGELRGRQEELVEEIGRLAEGMGQGVEGARGQGGEGEAQKERARELRRALNAMGFVRNLLGKVGA